MIEYVPEGTVLHRREEPVKRTGYDENGYCKAGSTDLYVILPNGKRKHRVWCTCVSNSASMWIKYNRKILHLHI
jgi:hypothetical protein